MQNVNKKKTDPRILVAVFVFIFIVQIIAAVYAKVEDMSDAFDHNIELLSMTADEIGKNYNGDSVDGYTYYRLVVEVKNNSLTMENSDYLSVGFTNEDDYYCSSEREGRAPAGEEQKYRYFVPVVPAGRIVPITYVVRVPDGSSKVTATVRDSYCIGTPSSVDVEL